MMSGTCRVLSYQCINASEMKFSLIAAQKNWEFYFTATFHWIESISFFKRELFYFDHASVSSQV